MAAECLVITVIILIIISSFLRRHRVKWALATAPLLLLPLANAATYAVSVFIFNSQLKPMTYITIIIIAVIIACMGIGICSIAIIKGKRTRIPYLAVTVLFNILLALILANYYYNLTELTFI